MLSVSVTTVTLTVAAPISNIVISLVVSVAVEHHAYLLSYLQLQLGSAAVEGEGDCADHLHGPSAQCFRCLQSEVLQGSHLGQGIYQPLCHGSVNFAFFPHHQRDHCMSICDY